MWLLIAAAAIFGLLVYVGRQSKSGKIKPGPWIKQGRALVSVAAVAVAIGGFVAIMRGQYLLGSLIVSAAFAMAGGARFRHQAKTPPPEGTNSLTEVEAYRLLGLPVGSDRKTILRAWKDRMKDAHPDQGGSNERAAKINAARDVLLKRR